MIRPNRENPDDWETPPAFFDILDREFGFTVDACAAPHNAKCDRYWTREQDGLAQDWSGERVFCNPPYGRETGRSSRRRRSVARTWRCCSCRCVPAGRGGSATR